MRAVNQEYYVGQEMLIHVVPKGNGKGPWPKGPHVVILGKDEGEDSKGNELGHPIKEVIEFKDLDDLALFQNGLEVMQRALCDNEDLKNEDSI